MERTYILGNSKPLEELGGTFIEIPNLINEVEIHNWVIELFRVNEINKVVVEIGENPLISLQIGYHIRLSIENIKDGVLVPIFYISKLSLNYIMNKTELYSQILATKGVFFSEYDLQSNKGEIEHLNGLNESEYLIKFLKVIHIQPDETFGRHSLANIWGAYALDKASNANALLDESKFKKSLYFKYVSAFNNIDKLKPSRIKVIGNINVGVVNKIKAESKRILLIDDEASKGWETVLRKIFKTSSVEDFVVINEKVKDFEALSEASKRIVESEEFDLYLVDLRLNGLEEDENLKTETFSGMKVLEKIKSLNGGNQVIVFTASNKVWNLKALLDAGADDYYMKESPEYNFSKTISEQNYNDFRENVEKCFERSYLKDIWNKTNNCKTHLYELKRNKRIDKDFIGAIISFLDLAFDSINKQYKNYSYDSSFMYYFLILEALAKQIFDEDKFIKVKIETISGKYIDGFKFGYRKIDKQLKDFEGNRFLGVNTGDDLISTQTRIPYNAKFHNLIDFANVPDISPINLVKLRNNFNHPDLINNRVIANIKKENVIEIFNVVNSLLINLN